MSHSLAFTITFIHAHRKPESYARPESKPHRKRKREPKPKHYPAGMHGGLFHPQPDAPTEAGPDTNAESCAEHLSYPFILPGSGGPDA